MCYDSLPAKIHTSFGPQLIVANQGRKPVGNATMKDPVEIRTEPSVARGMLNLIGCMSYRDAISVDVDVAHEDM